MRIVKALVQEASLRALVVITYRILGRGMPQKGLARDHHTIHNFASGAALSGFGEVDVRKL
jgi:hypothetical protein